MQRLFPLVILAALTGCSASSLDDARYPTGSASLVTSADSARVYAVNVDEGTISRLDTTTGVVTELAVGREPTRIARVGGKLLVTLRGERGIAVVSDSGLLTVERIVRTGTEPYGIVASEDGSRVFVALSTQGEVHELDGATLDVVRRWSIAGEPRWLALHPSGRSLYVGSGFGGLLHRVSLGADATVEPIPLPETTGNTGEPLTPRITGDIAVSPNGHQLAVPSLYVDNQTPVDDEGSANDTVQTSGYGSSGLGVSRMNPTVVYQNLDGSGNTVGVADSVLFSGFVLVDGMDEAVRSYPSSVAYAPDGRTVWATMEASQAIAVISTIPMHPEESSGFQSDTAAGSLGFATAPSAMISTDVGPRGLVFTSDTTAQVHSFLDRSVAVVDGASAVQMVKDGMSGNFFFEGVMQDSAQEGRRLTVSTLPAEVEAGRRLFYSATDDRMAGFGAGVSCSTCHFDGRNDGVTWQIRNGDRGKRNTPSLVGGVTDTAPMTWTDEVSSIAREAEITSQGRMGGVAITDTDLATIQAFVESQRVPDMPVFDADAALRGAAVYVEAGCNECHAGPALVDGRPHLIREIPVDTPTLRGIAATAPYFHDGSAPTLESVLLLSDIGAMGDTSNLSAAKKADLVSYLKSL